MSPLILKRAPIGRTQEDYRVLEDGVIVGRIFLSPAAPQDRPGCGPPVTTATFAVQRLRADARSGRWSQRVGGTSEPKHIESRYGGHHEVVLARAPLKMQITGIENQMV